MLKSLFSIDKNLLIQGKLLNYLIPLGSHFLKGNKWKSIISKLVFLSFKLPEENHCNIIILYVTNLAMDHIAFVFNTKLLYSTFWNVFIFLIKRGRHITYYWFSLTSARPCEKPHGVNFLFFVFPMLGWLNVSHDLVQPQNMALDQSVGLTQLQLLWYRIH